MTEEGDDRPVNRGWSESSASGDTLEVYTDPVLLVVEIWSALTDGCDVDTKLPEVSARRDQEPWRLHPYERTLVSWRRAPSGT